MNNTEELDEFAVKVDEDVYGPIKIDRIISDVKEGKLTDKAKFWDGEDWVPVSILLDDDEIFVDEWDTEKKNKINENGPPLDASSAWEDAERKGRWLMIYGDHLVIEGGKMNQEDFNNVIMGEPTNGGIPITKLLNVSFKNVGQNVEIKASSFHRMYEVYSLKCTLSKENSEELLKELEATNVRVTNN